MNSPPNRPCSLKLLRLDIDTAYQTERHSLFGPDLHRLDHASLAWRTGHPRMDTDI